MTDAQALADRLRWLNNNRTLSLAQATEICGKLGEIIFFLDQLAALTEQPQPFTGCQLRGWGECQSHGMCLSDACQHAGKTIRPRYMAEPKEDGIKYPSFAERNLIDRFGPKETK